MAFLAPAKSETLIANFEWYLEVASRFFFVVHTCCRLVRVMERIWQQSHVTKLGCSHIIVLQKHLSMDFVIGSSQI